MKLTIKELAQHLGKSEGYLRNLHSQGKLVGNTKFGISAVVTEREPITMTKHIRVDRFVIPE